MRRASLFLWVLFFGCSKSGSGDVAKRPDNFFWPPETYQEYPDLHLMDAVSGKRVRISDYKGKVLLIEPIGLNCPACNAFAGAKEKGAFPGMSYQKGLWSIEKSMDEIAGVSLTDERLVYMQLLLYGVRNKTPKFDTAVEWTKHFGLDKCKNCVVLVGEDFLLNQASYDMIPGFQLVDKDLILRLDSTGHHPKDSLWKELLPRVQEYL